MALAIKHIQYSDEVPLISSFELAPFEQLTSSTKATCAVTVADGGASGWDFWGQAVLSPESATSGKTPMEGQIVVSSLDHAEIVEAVRAHSATFDSWITLRFEGSLVFEDGE
jgi:hypothetical protein